MRLAALLVLTAACGGSSPAPVESTAPAASSAPAGGEPAAAGGPAETPQAAPTWTDTTVCSQRGDQYGQVSLTASQATGRYGHGSTRFDQVLSSVQRAVEVCGPAGELDWLFATSCADGSHPFADRAAAHAARRGSVGQGGRCGSVIDHYAVACPEQTYDVYMDMYMCGPGETMEPRGARSTTGPGGRSAPPG